MCSGEQPGSIYRAEDRSMIWLGLVAWVAPAVLAAMHAMTRARFIDHERMEWTVAFVRQLPFWLPLVLLAPVVFWFVRKFSFDRGRLGRSLSTHGIAALALGSMHLLLASVGSLIVLGEHVSPTEILNTAWELYLWSFHLYFFVVAALIAGAYSIESSGNLRVRELQASHLREQLSEAKLAKLRAQLRPHFLFNTLHSVSCLMDESVDRAKDVVTLLGQLLRHSLNGATGQEVELRHELVGVDLYLQIEKIRFQDRLEIHQEIAPGSLGALVPTFLLQPLVENAITHGVARHPGVGVLSLSASVVGGTLHLEVSNGGQNPDSETETWRPERVGLGHTRMRLGLLYGDAATLTIKECGPHGARVRIAVPFRTSSWTNLQVSR